MESKHVGLFLTNCYFFVSSLTTLSENTNFTVFKQIFRNDHIIYLLLGTEQMQLVLLLLNIECFNAIMV